MIIEPVNLNELRQRLAACHQEKKTVRAYRLRALNRLQEHSAADMTATAEAGMTLAAFQSEVGRQGQWLPVDPPNPDQLTLGALLATNANGPRRLGYGTIREHLIGIRVVLADGTLIKSGGKVVKNVAGFDLCKLFVGSQGTLGVIVEATFKLRPLPQTERFIKCSLSDWRNLEAVSERIWTSDLLPIAWDLHNLNAAGRPEGLTLVLGVAGSPEEVDWQLEKAGELGLREPATLDYQTQFWSPRQPGQPCRWSVLPSRLVPALRQLESAPFVAHAGNGVIWHRGTRQAPAEELPLTLIQGAKDAFDPNHVLPDLAL